MSTVTSPSAGDSITATYGAAVATVVNGIMDYGWLPYAYPQGVDAQDATSASTNLFTVAAGLGGVLLQPIYLPGPMKLQSISIRNGATASARAAEFALYQDTGSTTLAQVTGTTGTFSFTPAGADDRTANIGTPGTLLYPGVVWVAIRNTSTGQQFAVRHYAAPTELAFDLAMTNNSTGMASLASTLDAATNWSAVGFSFGIRLNGRVMGGSSAF